MHDVVLIAVSSFHPKKTSQCLEVVFLIVSLRPEQTIKFIITMNDLKIIQEKIYEIRGQRVMLDFDLAEAYGVETAQLKRQVRRNIERFEGDDFMFVVTRDELSRCQIGTLNRGRGRNIKYLPFAFTELGVAMLSSVLRRYPCPTRCHQYGVGRVASQRTHKERTKNHKICSI